MSCRKWPVLVFLASLVALAAGVVWLCVSDWRTGGMSEEEANALAAALDGSSRDQVEAALDQRGIRYTYFSGLPGDWFGNESVASMSGLPEKQVGGTVRAVADGGHDWASHTEIYLYFFFDRNDRLIGHKVRTFIIGL